MEEQTVPIIGCQVLWLRRGALAQSARAGRGNWAGRKNGARNLALTAVQKRAIHDAVFQQRVRYRQNRDIAAAVGAPVPQSADLAGLPDTATANDPWAADPQIRHGGRRHRNRRPGPHAGRRCHPRRCGALTRVTNYRSRTEGVLTSAWPIINLNRKVKTRCRLRPPQSWLPSTHHPRRLSISARWNSRQRGPRAFLNTATHS